MTEEDIAAMHQDVEEQARILSGTYTIPADGMKKLMAEYGERCVKQVPVLLAEVERMREIVQTVAHHGEFDAYVCIFGGECDPLWNAVTNVYNHASDCPVTKARAILSK